MKKAILMKRILSIIMVLTLLIPISFVKADEGIKIFVDNQQLSVNGIIVNGSTLVPLRAIFEALDSRVRWDSKTQTITALRPYKIIELTIGKTQAFVGGAPVSLTVPPRIINGSTYVPLRFVSEALGAEVVWEESTKSVLIKNTFTKEEMVDRLVTVPDTNYDTLEVEEIIRNISNIPVEFLTDLLAMDMEIRLVNGKITDQPELLYLRGVIPKGWESTGLTWDDIPGIRHWSSTKPRLIVMRIGYSDFGQGHDSQNLEINLIAGSINNYILTRISDTEEFKTIHNKEHQNFLPNYIYSDDYFAESFVYYYLNDDSRNQLKEKAPLTFNFFENLLEYKEKIDELLDGY